MVRQRARAGVVPLRGPSGQVFLAPAHHGPLPMGATVGAQAVKVPQIQFFDDKVAGQFHFLDKVVVSGGWGAAALSRWCSLRARW